MSLTVSAEIMRRCEERHFAAGTANALELMQIAGNGCAELCLDFLAAQKNCRRIVIFAGSGNNGGDGVVMASHLVQNQGLPVVLALIDRQKISESSAFYYKKLDQRVTVATAAQVEFQRGDLVIDALLGTGCRAPMKEPYRSIIEYINNAHLPVFSVDIPSGLGTDRCIKANITAAIGFYKDIFFTTEGIEMCGALRRVPLPLDIAPDADKNAPLAADSYWFNSISKPVLRNVHKYQRGSVLICGGSRDFMQAPYLSAHGALRAGAGLVRLAVPFAPVPGVGILAAIPTQVTDCNGQFCQKSLDDLQNAIARADVIAAGPGMGRSQSVKEFIQALLALEKPLLLDADALVAAADLFNQEHHSNILLTPHRGEARFLAEALQIELCGDDLADARVLAQKSRCTVLLKGPRSVTAAPDGRAFINTSGTPALATAGSGDVLTGIAAAEMCCFAPLEAGARAAFLHGMAGELAAAVYGKSGVIADDLPQYAARAEAQLQKIL